MTSPGLVAFLTLLTVPLFAEQPDRSGWQYDAVMPEHVSDIAPAAGDINAINDVIAKMLECWNAHDVDGYLSAFSKSPQLLVVFQNDQYQGWDALRAGYTKTFHDPTSMGNIRSTRVQIKLTGSGLALIQGAWTVNYPNRSSVVVGASTMTFQKLDGTWKIISCVSRYSSTTSRGWEYDSISPERETTSTSSDQADIQAINFLLTNMDHQWNAHDIDGYMSAFWKSTELLVVVQEEQYQGWETLYKAYKSGFQDPNTMGTSEASRIQIKLLRPDFAVASNWWNVSYPNSKIHVVGNTMMDLQKLPDGWKIIAAHSSFAEP
jgi:uncharacterized protein (TIGR02246 family)